MTGQFSVDTAEAGQDNVRRQSVGPFAVVQTVVPLLIEVQEVVANYTTMCACWPCCARVSCIVLAWILGLVTMGEC